MKPADLARAMGVSRTAVMKWENAASEPSAGNLRRMADILGTSLDWLGQGSGAPIPDRVVGILPDGVRIDAASLGEELSRPLLGAIKGRNAEIWRVESDTMQAAQLHPNDYVVVDLSVPPRARDIVLVEHMMVPLFRLFLPPYLYGARTIGLQPQPLVVDNIQTLVKGVVVSRHSIS